MIKTLLNRLMEVGRLYSLADEISVEKKNSRWIKHKEEQLYSEQCGIETLILMTGPENYDDVYIQLVILLEHLEVILGDYDNVRDTGLLGCKGMTQSSTTACIETVFSLLQLLKKNGHACQNEEFLKKYGIYDDDYSSFYQGVDTARAA